MEWKVETMQDEVGTYYLRLLLKIMASDNTQQNQVCLYFITA